MRIALWTAALLMMISAGLAQTPDEAWNNLRQLRTGQKVRLQDSTSREIEGTFLGLNPEGLSLRVKNQPIFIPRSEVRTVVLPASRARQILLGILAGALMGASVWTEVDRQQRGCWDDEDVYGNDLGCDDNGKGLSSRSLAIFTGVGAGTVGIASALAKGPGKVIYWFNPAWANADRTPVGLLEELPLDLRPSLSNFAQSLQTLYIAQSDCQAGALP